MDSHQMFQGIVLEWEGSGIVFDDVPYADRHTTTEFEGRVYLSRRQTDLQDMISRISLAIGFASVPSFAESNTGKAALAFLIVCTLNPYKIKLLPGSGLDSLIENSCFDEETGEFRTSHREFLKFCNENSWSSTMLDWFKENGFIRTKDDAIFFRSRLKKGRVFNFA